MAQLVPHTYCSEHRYLIPARSPYASHIAIPQALGSHMHALQATLELAGKLYLPNFEHTVLQGIYLCQTEKSPL